MKNLYILSLIMLLSVNPKAEAMFARMAGLVRTTRSSMYDRMYRAFSSEPENFIDVGGAPVEQTDVAVPALLEQNPFAAPQVAELALPKATSKNDFSAQELAVAYRSFASTYFNNPQDKAVLELPVDNAIPMFARLHARNVLAGKMRDYIFQHAMKAKNNDSIFWEFGPVGEVKFGVQTRIVNGVSSPPKAVLNFFPLQYQNIFAPLYTGKAECIKVCPSEELVLDRIQGRCDVALKEGVTCAIAPQNIQHVQAFIRNRENPKLEELKKQHAILLAQAHGNEEKEFLAQELAKGIERFEKYVVAETAKYLDALPQEISRLIE